MAKQFLTFKRIFRQFREFCFRYCDDGTAQCIFFRCKPYKSIFGFSKYPLSPVEVGPPRIWDHFPCTELGLPAPENAFYLPLDNRCLNVSG